MLCPKCQFDCPPDYAFCPKCGRPLTASPEEPVSRLELELQAERLQRLVPREYAERLLGARGQVGRDRRIVTMLFCDIKGSTAMAEKLDPEDVMEIMDGAFDLLIEPVYRYEGTLARLMGDAVLAFFGAPIAHEDDAQRAALAALEIVAGVRRYAARLEEERGIRGFDVRAGIHTGLVVVGEVGSDLRAEYTAMGDAVNLAARLESAAEPGTVLVSEDTHRLIAPLFETVALDPIEVKGRSEPVPVYRVLAAREQPGKPRGIPGLESPLVGREAEFAALRKALERLQAGVGGIVTVVGEAGIGKSRLVAEVRKGAVTAPLRWVEGRCLSYGTSIAYLLWLDVLRGLLGVTAEDAPGDVGVALRAQVESLCPDQVHEVYPFLAAMMSVPLEAEVEATLARLDGQELKAGTFQAVERLLAVGCRPGAAGAGLRGPALGRPDVGRVAGEAAASHRTGGAADCVRVPAGAGTQFLAAAGDGRAGSWPATHRPVARSAVGCRERAVGGQPAVAGTPARPTEGADPGTSRWQPVLPGGDPALVDRRGVHRAGGGDGPLAGDAGRG